MPTKTKQSTQTKKADPYWKPQFHVMIYQLALEGLTNAEIAKTLETPGSVFKRWYDHDDGVAFAVSEGRNNFEKNKVGSHTLQDYIVGHMSADMKKVWKEVSAVQKESNSILRINRIFAKHGEVYRKYLFIHALMRSRYNPSKACKMLGISRNALNRWIEEDISFARQIEEIEWHKNNFFEDKFMELVGRGNSQCVQMAMRTRNKDRGYGESTDINHTGSIVHQNMVDVTSLPLKLQTAILAAMREVEAQKLLTVQEEENE